MAQDHAKQLSTLKEKYEQLTEWMKLNTRHKDFSKVVSERNDLSVQMEVVRQQRNGTWKPMGIADTIVIYQPIN